MLFLVLLPGLIAAGFALAEALLWTALRTEPGPLWSLFGTLWVSRILGLLVPLPLLLVLVTPLLARSGWVRVPPPTGAGGNPWQRWSSGEVVEVTGLTLSSTVLVLVLLGLQLDQGVPPWSLWGVGLMIVVWSALRLGLRGGVLVSGAAAVVALAVASGPAQPRADWGPLQGYLLAQCSTAVLVGVSSGWIQTSEARYRHVVSEVPLVLYSAHLPRALRVTGSRDARTATLGPVIGREAVVTLVSRASHQVFGRAPEQLTGSYRLWLGCVVPEDRELVIAALEQLGLQRQPITCEYRVFARGEPSPGGAVNDLPVPTGPAVRWVRDSLTPHYTEDGLLDGWEGFVEDISERRRLADHVRRSTQMLQSLVANLPAGVFFVQGPQGMPLLANARARQLLGQREDGSVPLAQLSRMYRLHRTDGSEYPADELPVARALRQGVTCTADDIVVYRPDGRKIPLMTWAAPVQLNGAGPPDAAVWVLEDGTVFQHAEGVRRAELPAILRSIRELAEAAQRDVPADHPFAEVLRRIAEMSSATARRQT